jgi:S-formylglutathione hydrolase
MSVMKTLGEHRAFGGTQGYYEHVSAACSGPMKFAVFVPERKGSASVPVLYYLAGLTCTEETFTTKGGAQRVASELGVALVMPDTSPRAVRYPGDDASWDFGLGAGFYVDATESPWSSGYRMFSYVTEELPALVESHFGLDGARRGIFGHSMGGHGALVCALRRPDLYRTVSAFAPIGSPSRVPWGEKAFSAYLGPDREAWLAYDATALVERGKRQSHILVDQGLADKFLERELRPEIFEAACKAHGQELTVRRHAGYDHGYFFVSTFTEDPLRHPARGLQG